MMQKSFIYILFIVFTSFIVFAADQGSIWNPLTKGYADTLYCMIGGNCQLNNLSVNYLTAYNKSVINITNSLCLNDDCISEWDNTSYWQDNGDGSISPKDDKKITATGDWNIGGYSLYNLSWVNTTNLKFNNATGDYINSIKTNYTEEGNVIYRNTYFG